MIKMIKIKEEELRIINMGDMEPLQVGEIDKTTGIKKFIGLIVMRTASKVKFEVMCISEARPDHCWTGPVSKSLKVRLLPPGKSITVEIKNGGEDD